MQNIIRRFETAVKVVHPDYSSSAAEKTVVKFVSALPANDSESADMIGYTFEEAIADVESPFSITLLPSVDKDGKSWMDKIAPMDLVFYEEFGETRYCGLVSDVRYVAQMGDNGPVRTIVIQGSGFGKLLSTFKLALDYHLWLKGQDAETASTNLIREIEASGKKLRSTLQAIYKNFIILTTVSDSGASSSGVKALIDRYIDIDTGISNDLEAWYDLAIGLYQTGENDIWGIWKSIIPAPIYELFGRWDQGTQKYQIIARQSPFDAKDWKSLDTVAVKSGVLTDYSVGRSNSEVKTFFFGSMPGCEINRLETLTLDQYKSTRKVNEDKWPMYGYRPMEIVFRYFKRDAETTNSEQVLAKAANMMYNWYRKNDELLSGQITVIGADDEKIMKYPKIGEKLSFLGGEWYIERTARSWSYGKSPKTVLSVTRGYIYQDGEMQSPISGLSKRLLEVEEGKS